jgi:hypothetical protein
MQKRCWAALPIVLAGCATRLDFDALSAGEKGDPDASLDAGYRDAPELGSDATALSPDAGPMPRNDQSPATFSCERVTPAPTFCDDFENDSLLERWGDVTTTRTPQLGGTIAHDSTAPRAGMSSLLAVLDQGVTPCDGCLHVGVGKGLPDFVGPTRVTIEFDVRVDQADSRPQHSIMLWRYILGRDDIGYTMHTLMLDSANGDGLSAAFVEWDADGVGPDVVIDQNTELPPVVPYWHDEQPALGLYQWSHVKYVLDAAGVTDRGVNVTLTIDDVELFNNVPHYAVHNGHPRLEMGIPEVTFTDFSQGESTEIWRVRYDNVLVRNEALPL